MTAVVDPALSRYDDEPSPSPLVHDLEAAHRSGVAAAVEGMSDAALGAGRLSGPGVPVLAEAAVTSATPYLRAPLLARISSAALLHEAGPDGLCSTCAVAHPCPTRLALLG